MISDVLNNSNALNAHKNTLSSKSFTVRKFNNLAKNQAYYAKKGDSKYKAVMDSNDDRKITYKEYLEYCKQNAKEEKTASNAKTEENDGKMEVKNPALAINEYAKTEPPEGKIEIEA